MHRLPSLLGPSQGLAAPPRSPLYGPLDGPLDGHEGCELEAPPPCRMSEAGVPQPPQPRGTRDLRRKVHALDLAARAESVGSPWCLMYDAAWCMMQPSWPQAAGHVTCTMEQESGLGNQGTSSGYQTAEPGTLSGYQTAEPGTE